MLESSEKILGKSQNTVLKEMGDKETLDADYSDGIPVAEYRDESGYLKIEINSTTVIGMLGPSGAGKTTGNMAIASRLRNKGRLLVNLADSDLHMTNLDNNGGVSKRLQERMGMYRGEEPREIGQQSFLPKYLYNNLKESRRPSNVDIFSLGFTDLNESELKFLLGQGLDKNQKLSMQSVLDEVDVDNNLDFDELKTIADEKEDIHHQTASKLKRNIEVLDNSEIVSNRLRKDVLKPLKNGDSLGIGMKGFKRLDDDDYYLMEFYAKKIAEKIIDARLDGEVENPLIGILPEAHDLMPRNSDSDFADILKENFTFYGRRSDFPFILDTQNPSQLPRKILNELNHVFIGVDKDGATLAKNEWSKVLSLMNLNPNPNKDNKRWTRIFQSMSHHEFLYLNQNMRGPEDAEVVEFLAPLTSNP